LSPEQQAAYDRIKAFIRDRHSPYRAILLQGYAGTGKTTTVSRLVQEMTTTEMFAPAIAVSAPTNKAVRVLRRQSSLGDSATYATIHSLFGLKEHTDPKTGKQLFKQNLGDREPRIEEFDILIVDEVSMLQRVDPKKKTRDGEAEEVDFYELIDAQVSRGLKLILMGDPVQIPPVNSPDAVPFDEDMRKRYKIDKVELKTVMRQALDNPILSYATDIRRVYQTGNAKPVAKINPATGHGIHVLSAGEQVRPVLNELFTSERFREDPDYAKVIAWTNRTVDLYNAEIRKMIYGKDMLPKIMLGERLVADKPVFKPGTTIMALTTSEEALVKSMSEIEIPVEILVPKRFEGGMNTVTENIPAYELYLEIWDINGPTYRTVHTLHEAGEEKFQALQLQQKNTALKAPYDMRRQLWSRFYGNENKFGKFKYNYALTAHKSQGSTYDNVVMLEWDIDKNPKTEERNRIKYVAATRARHLLYVVQF
jgi:exodeoxyribonuclease-5